MISMKKVLAACLMAAMPLFSAGSSQAATLNDVTAVPSPSGTSAAIGFTVTDGLLNAFLGPTVAGPGTNFGILQSSGVGGTPSHATGLVFGLGGGVLLAGDYEDSAVIGPGTIQALFLKTGGSLAADYGGDYLLLTLTAGVGPIALFGTNVYAGTATLTGAVLDAAVPLPAGGLLLGSALVLAALRRRQAS
ncbi:hypothetical protein [Mangrovicoccus ximenensis]|uniref:hypothetical protein n=1 Tax=Mangrovicoccus ximenensis TaxID=1911570 RepID=UPI000D39B9BB|nr:hypothetical protein [Mangrovicoccus ximenensis]